MSERPSAAGGPGPATRPEAGQRILCTIKGHEWRYFEDKTTEYTGYLERCARCGAIMQVPL